MAKDYDPGIEVSHVKSGNGYKSWYVTVPVGKTSSTAIVKHYDTNEFVLDIADFFPGDAGRTVYQMVGDLAHNTGGVFIGDPNGLSDIAQVRRTEAMISSALRWDSTDHLEPHKLQLNPEVGDVSGFKWKKGDTDFNLGEMLRVSSENVYKKVPR